MTVGVPDDVTQGEPVEMTTRGSADAEFDVVGEVLADYMPEAVFGTVPLFALILMAYFRRPRRYYVEHLIFSLHNFAFLFVILGLTWPTEYLGETLSWIVDGPILVWIAVYLVLSLPRVYGQSKAKTVIKSGLLLGSYVVILLLTVAAALVAIIGVRTFSQGMASDHYATLADSVVSLS
jgi:hypothetical protein